MSGMPLFWVLLTTAAEELDSSDEAASSSSSRRRKPLRHTGAEASVNRSMEAAGRLEKEGDRLLPLIVQVYQSDAVGVPEQQFRTSAVTISDLASWPF